MKKIAIILLAAAILLCAVSCAPQPLTEKAKELLEAGSYSAVELAAAFELDPKSTTGVTKSEYTSGSAKGSQYTYSNCQSLDGKVQSITGTLTEYTSEGSSGTITINLTKFYYENSTHNMYAEGTFSGSFPKKDTIKWSKLSVDGVSYDPNTL